MREKKPIHERQNKGESELRLKISSPGNGLKGQGWVVLVISYKYGMKGQVLRSRGLWDAMSQSQDWRAGHTFLSYPLWLKIKTI